eukprot:m51a1_g9126 putative high affinity cgmp-specific 3 -cyclic phosphodiesterase 9a-like (149) ;mRNA; f:2749-3195
MSFHLDILSKFNMKLQSGFNPDQEDHRLSLMQMLIKASDVNNIAKPAPVYAEWTSLVLQEFFMQGDREKEMGMPVSAFMDRTQPNVGKSQVGFIEFVGMPLFASLCNFIGSRSKAALENLTQNLKKWKAEKSRDSSIRIGSMPTMERL